VSFSSWPISLYGLLCGLVLHYENALFPDKFDPILYRLDGALGLSSAAIAATLRAGRPGLLLDAVDRSLLLAMALWYGMTLERGHSPSILRAYLAEMLVGPVLYGLLLACGPIYAFATYPAQLPHPAMELLRLSGDPNAVPSLHMSTAFLLILFSPTLPCRVLSMVFAALTALATLATGEHYIIDLIIGLPFGLFAASAAHRRTAKAAIYLGIVLVWLMAIRSAPNLLVEHPALLRVAVGAVLTLASIELTNSWRAFRQAGDPTSNRLVARVVPLNAAVDH